MNQNFRLPALLAASVLFIALSWNPMAAQVRERARVQPAAPQITETSANRAVDMYIKIDGVEGESRDKDHKNWIEIVSWTWGNTNSAARQTQPAVGGPGTLNVVRRADKASPKLLEASTKGKALGRVVVHVRASNGAYTEYVITDARVRGYNKSSAGDRPSESLTLNFGKVESSEKPNGDPDRPVVIGR